MATVVTNNKIRDENDASAAEAASSIAAATLQAYVPSGDQRLVLSAIDNQLNLAKESWKQRNGCSSSSGDKNDNNSSSNNTDREEFFMQCIDKTGASLKQQLELVTVPADEEEVERLLDTFQTRLLSTRPSSGDNDNVDDDDDESLSSVDDINEDIEFDDNEICDEDAYNQVKELRAKARDISNRVISIREETSGRALDMTRRDITELMRIHGFSENVADDENNDDDEDEKETNEQKKRDSINPMHVALQTLTSSLQNVDSELADKLESIKETIGTIDSSVEKYQSGNLSQIEKALLASDEPRQAVLGSDDDNEEEEGGMPMNPDKKLARLLAGIL